MTDSTYSGCLEQGCGSKQIGAQQAAEDRLT
jgi:hypothetical protein